SLDRKVGERLAVVRDHTRAEAQAKARGCDAARAEPHDHHLFAGKLRHGGAAYSLHALDTSTQLQARKAHECQENGDDPEADDDLRLGPPLLFEVVVDG